MRFIQKFKMFESVDPIPEVGTKWINDKGEKIFILTPDQYGNIGYYYLSDPEYKRHMKINTFYTDFKPLDKNIYRDDVEYDFDKAVYLSDERAIIGAYFITSENVDDIINNPNKEGSVEILNVKEFCSETGTFGDNAMPYSVTFHRGSYPISKIAILGPVPEKEGFFFIKVPYWLYKETPELNIKRCVGYFHGMKRLDLRDISLSDKKFMSNFKDPDVVRYFANSNIDKRTQKLVNIYSKMGL